MAFFQSYRDLNFITLVPEKAYAKDWHDWRFLPHFKVQGINTRGIVHNAKSRDMVLSSFYQIVNPRKQTLAAAGREKPTFLPHFVFTIFDDSYLAGHGLNEFLAEDMADLGVTVIWCKEDKKLLPETITSLVAVKNSQAGVLIQNNGHHLDKLYKPYPPLEDEANFDVILRQLSSLVHMEVEKNAIPERLSLLEQYMVETVEALAISECWAQADPSKSIAAMIGWKGKKEAAFWDLHEQVHGPHAIVGGTSGSGKSEFLTTFLMGLAINFSPEDIGMLIIDWKGGGIADTLADLPHFMGSITNLDGAGTARALASINAGFGKSTALQTIVMNLARQNTPEQIHFNLLDFGTNGLLPLKDLPHVADIVTLEEHEKLQKMLNRIMQNLAERKSLFKKAGVATLSQYQAKTKQELPILVTILDAYDGLNQTDNRKDAIDNLLVTLLREGAALGMYLVFSAGRYNAIRMNMMANIQTKLALFLNDENDLGNLFGRDKLAQMEMPGRAQIKLDQQLALQIYLPVKGDSEVEVLTALESEITVMTEAWTGSLPQPIPMVPDELDTQTFDHYISETVDPILYFGLNKASSEPETFELFKGRTLGIFPETAKQAKVIYPFLTDQLLNQVSSENTIVIDTNNSLAFLMNSVSLYIGKKMLKAEPQLVKDALEDLIEKDVSMQQLVIINGISEIFEKLSISPDQVLEILGLQNLSIQLIFMDNMSRIANNYSITGPLKENTYQLLFGGDLNTQRFINNISMDLKKEVYAKNVLHAIKDEEVFNIVVPTEKEGE